MARPQKTGLDYFPFDVDFFDDEKMVCIGGEFGVKGELAAVKLLCAIYHSGYFAEWNELLRYKLLRQLPGVSAQLLEDIVNRLVIWGFFDRALFDSARILTSEGIQRRYFEIARRRKGAADLPYILVNATETRVNAAKTPVNAALTPQIKEKEIKEKETKTKKTEAGDSAHTCAKAPAPGDFENFSFSPPLAGELIEAVRDPDVQRYGPTLADARAFFDHYSARGWMMGGAPMRDWRAAFRSWLAKKSRYGESTAPTGPAAPSPARLSDEKPRQPEEPYTPPPAEFFEQLDRSAPWNRPK